MGYDYINSNMGNYLTGLYYYILDKANVNETNSKVYGFAPTIQNISFNPFIELSDVSTTQCNFDKSYFGMSNSVTPLLYRITSFNKKDKLIGEFDIVTHWQDYKNYSAKMLYYPYRYFILTDYINPPLLIQPQLMNTNSEGKWEFKVKIALSQTSKYTLYANRYKGDYNGNLEGIVNNNPLLFPVASSQYSSWLMSNGSTFSATNNLALMENDLSLTQGNEQINFNRQHNWINGANGVVSGGSILGSLMGAFTGGYNLGISYQQLNMEQEHLQQNANLKEHSIETMALARKQDYLNTPRAIKTVGNDGIYSMENGHKRVDLIEYGLTNAKQQRIYSYFDKYGYKVNLYTKPNFTSRKYWNFIKTVNCNIDSAQIPHNDLMAIQNIFNSGITFWHIDNGAIVKDYSKNNIEI